MQHESQLIFRGGVFVLKNHSAVSVLRALIRILATDKSKADGPGIVDCGRGDGST